MNRIAMGLVAGLATLAMVGCSHDHTRYSNSVGGGPSGAESSSRGGKFSGQMNRGDYGMYGDPNVSTSGGKPGSQPMQSTGGGPTSGSSYAPSGATQTSAPMENSSSAPSTSSGRPWYEDAR